MKRKISLILSISIIIGIFSGCAIKKEAGATGENPAEPSWEETFEITPEITKEPATDENGKDTDGDKDKEENDKPEVTPEFYDFMTLDPDVDIENEHVREDIRKKIDDYILNEIGPMFTKKEIYLYQLYYKDTFTTNSSFSYDLKFGKTDFYSQNTKKKLNELEFEFGPAHITAPGIYTYSQLRSSTLNYSREEYVSKLEQALKILLEDHNVTYVSIGSVVSVD